MTFMNDRGNIAVMAALSMSLVVGGAGFGVETGYWYYEQVRMQQAADAAAYTAAVELRAGSGEAKTEAGATAAATSNGWRATTDTIEVISPSPSRAGDPNSVDVELTRTIPRAFTALFDDTPVVVRVKATAAYSTAGNACVLALDKSASQAIKFSGSSTADMQGCVVMANSVANDAVYTDGNASVIAPCILAVGGADIDVDKVELTQCSSVLTNQSPAADPYKDVPYPTTGPCVNFGGGFTPGTCYKSNLSLNGDVDIPDGVYVIDGVSLKINAGAHVTGENVTFVLLNGASLEFNGNATIQLSAPTTGTYKGMLFMGSRTSSAGGINRFNGTADSKLTGALYFPKQNVEYKGNFSGNGGCTQIVANQVEWSGNTHFTVDCTAHGLEPIVAGSAVRLVG